MHPVKDRHKLDEGNEGRDACSSKRSVLDMTVGQAIGSQTKVAKPVANNGDAGVTSPVEASAFCESKPEDVAQLSFSILKRRLSALWRPNNHKPLNLL